MKIKANRRVRGFSLVELIVAMGLFVMVAFVATTALLSVSNASRKAKSSQQVVDNISLALEDMTRNIRTGDTYHCGSPSSDLTQPVDCPLSASQPSFLAFKTIDANPLGEGKLVIYYLYTVSGRGTIMKSVDGGATFQPLTLDSVDVENLSFIVDGSTPNDLTHAHVTILMRALINEGKREQTRLHLQTSISQRAGDL